MSLLTNNKKKINTSAHAILDSTNDHLFFNNGVNSGMSASIVPLKLYDSENLIISNGNHHISNI